MRNFHENDELESIINIISQYMPVNNNKTAHGDKIRTNYDTEKNKNSNTFFFSTNHHSLVQPFYSANSKNSSSHHPCQTSSLEASSWDLLDHNNVSKLKGSVDVVDVKS